MAIQRAQHWTDRPHPTLQGQRSRKIKNWANFKTPSQDFAPTSLARAAIEGAQIPDWVGQNDFSHATLEAPLQVFVRDAMDVGNRAMVGVRRSDKPGGWLNAKALDVQPTDVVVTTEGGASVFTFPGIWPGCDLIYTAGAHKLKEVVRIWDKSIAPAYFEWTLKHAPGHTLSVANDKFSLVDEDGAGGIEARAPWGEDSATTAPTASGKQYIRCTLTEQDSRQGLRVVRLTPNAEDMSGAVGVVELDPTTVISGVADIEDSYLWEGNGFPRGPGNQISFGTYTTLAQRWHGVVRISDITSIPAGVLTGFRYKPWRYSGSTSVNAGDYDFYVIKDANAWVENTTIWVSTGVAPWAGSSGCSTSGTDYDADASPPTINLPAFLTGPPVGLSIDLTPQWATDWRDGTRLPNGFMGRDRSETVVHTIMQTYSTELTTPSYLPVIEIDYAAAGNPAYYFDMLRMQ